MATIAERTGCKAFDSLLFITAKMHHYRSSHLPTLLQVAAYWVGAQHSFSLSHHFPTSLQVTAEPHTEGLNPCNALQLISQYDVILDASDNPATRYLVR